MADRKSLINIDQALWAAPTKATNEEIQGNNSNLWAQAGHLEAQSPPFRDMPAVVSWFPTQGLLNWPT